MRVSHAHGNCSPDFLNFNPAKMKTIKRTIYLPSIGRMTFTNLQTKYARNFCRFLNLSGGCDMPRIMSLAQFALNQRNA